MIAQQIVEDLEAALDQFRLVAVDLSGSTARALEGIPVSRPSQVPLCLDWWRELG